MFITPPAIRSSDTTRKDTIVKELAADFGLSNISNKDGEAVKKAPDSGTAAPQFTPPNPQVMAAVQRLGANADGFSGVLPSLQRSGRPHQWTKQRLK